MPSNTAAWTNAKHAKLEVGPAHSSPAIRTMRDCSVSCSTLWTLNSQRSASSSANLPGAAINHRSSGVWTIHPCTSSDSSSVGT